MKYHHLKQSALAGALASAAEALSTLAAELHALHEAGSFAHELGAAGAMPFVIALQQLGVTGAILASRLSEPGNEHQFDRSIREWLDVAQLAVDLLDQASEGSAT